MSTDQSLVFIIDDDPSMRTSIELDRGRRAEAAMLAELWQRFDPLTPREREVMRKMEAKSLPGLVRFADRLAADTTKP